MVQYLYPVLFALFIWWFSTGLILYLDGLPKHTMRWSMLGATVLAAIAIAGLIAVRSDTGLLAVYIAFTAGVVLWGWHEITFLMGLVTGPNKQPCPADCTGWRRFVAATRTLIYHEIAIFLTAAGLIALTWGADNQVGTWTFVILWIMRLSTKLNVFLGVPNITENFLPEHLHHLKSYFARRPMNLLFPVSVTVSTVAAAALVTGASAAAADLGQSAGFTFLATLLILAVLEHWFLVLPIPVEKLWRWGLRSHAAGKTDTGNGATAPVPEKRNANIKTTLLNATQSRVQSWSTNA